MAKAQSTQVYVIVGVVFFFGIVLGFKLIYDFIQTSSDMRLMEFHTRLKADVDAVMGKPGAVQRYTYNLPYRSDAVCFHDPHSPLLAATPQNPLIKDEMAAGKNLFIYSGYQAKSLKIDNLRAPSTYYCLNATRNSITVFLEGVDGQALIKKAD